MATNAGQLACTGPGPSRDRGQTPVPRTPRLNSPVQPAAKDGQVYKSYQTVSSGPAALHPETKQILHPLAMQVNGNRIARIRDRMVQSLPIENQRNQER